MILLIFFLSFLFGAYIKFLPFLLPLICILWVIFLSKRYGKNIAIVSSLLIALGTGLGFMHSLPTSLKSSSLTGFVTESKTNYFIFRSGGQRFYIYNKNNSYEIGDILTIEGEKENLDFVTIESQFDFEEYLNKKGIYKELTPNSIKVKFSNPIRINKFREKFLSNFEPEISKFVGSFLFNQNQDNEIEGYGKYLHLGRFFSLSGFYLYAFIGMLSGLFRFLMDDKWAKLIAYGVLSLLFVLTLPNFSVIRIMTIGILSWINEHILKKRFSHLNIVIFVAIIFTLFDFYVIYSDAFILGFGIPIIFKITSRFAHSYKFYFRKLISATLIYFFFIPFEIKYYNSINIFLFLYQYLLTPIFLFVGFLSLICLYHIPAYNMVNNMTSGLRNVLSFLSKISFEIYAKPFNDYAMFLMIFLYLVFLYYLSIRFKPFLKWIGIIYALIYLVSFVPFTNYISEEVSFINVGQGDCCLIRDKLNTILIDTGGSLYYDIANDSLIPYFKKRRIYNIDLVITTHDDYDHMGALKELKKNFTVKKHISSYQDFPLTIGKISFTNYNTFITGNNDDNDNSLVIGFSLCNKDFLITGDARKEIENQIMSTYSNIPCDILKAGHHGSKTSTSDAFIKYLNPKEAIISVGRNYYGHPNQEVINILKNNNVLIKRTDILGTITYTRYCLI